MGKEWTPGRAQNPEEPLQNQKANELYPGVRVSTCNKQPSVEADQFEQILTGKICHPDTYQLNMNPGFLFLIALAASNSFFRMLIPNLLVKNGTNPTSRPSNCMIQDRSGFVRISGSRDCGRPQFASLTFVGILIPKQLSTCLITEQVKEEG